MSFNTININASFFAESGKAEKKLALVPQFFDAVSNTWITVGAALATEKGLLNAVVKLAARSAAITQLKKVAAAGGAPPFRLVLESSLAAGKTEVAAIAPAITSDAAAKTLSLQFGSNFAQPTEVVKNYLKNDAATLLYAALPSDTAAAAEVENLKKEKNKLLEDIAASNEKLKETAAMQEAERTEFAAIKKEMAVRDKAMVKLEKDMARAEAKALKEQETLNDKLATAETAMSRLDGIIAEKDVMIGEAAAAAAVADNELMVMRLQLESMNNTINQNTAIIKTLTNQLQSRELELKTRDSMLEQQMMRNTELENKINEMTKEMVEYKPEAQPVSKVYASILDEFKKTNELGRDSAYRLSNISLNIKTFVEHDANGIRMQLVDANKLSGLNPDLLSDFKVEIGDTGTNTGGTIRLPDLLGLTETAVRKIVTSLGLSLRPVYQNKKEVPNGQAFKQSPAAGEVKPNETITVVFSKN